MHINNLATAPLGRLLFTYALPGMTAMLVNALYNIVDQIFIGHGVGFLGNGAANVTLLITMLSLALSLMIGDGMAAWFSLRLGEGNKTEAASAAATGLTLAAMAGLISCALCLAFLAPLLSLLGATGEILPLALDYGGITVLGLPLIMFCTSANALLRADGTPRRAMIIMLSGAFLNACLDPVFIFDWGFGWGIKGAAWATVCGQSFSFGLSLYYLRHLNNIRLKPALFRPRPGLMLRLCGMGASSFIDQCSFTLVMAVNNNLLTWYGAKSVYGPEIPITAYGVSMKVQEILFTVLLGLALGMQPIAGYNRGAGRMDRAKKVYYLAVAAGTVISCLATVLFVFAPGHIINLFGAAENPLYREFSQHFFSTYFLLYPFFAFITITGVYFQATGLPGRAAGLALCYQLVFKIGAALWLCSVMGLDGVLWSGPLADACAMLLAGVLLAVSFYNGKVSSVK